MKTNTTELASATTRILDGDEKAEVQTLIKQHTLTKEEAVAVLLDTGSFMSSSQGQGLSTALSTLESSVKSTSDKVATLESIKIGAKGHLFSFNNTSTTPLPAGGKEVDIIASVPPTISVGDLLTNTGGLIKCVPPKVGTMYQISITTSFFGVAGTAGDDSSIRVVLRRGDGSLIRGVMVTKLAEVDFNGGGVTVSTFCLNAFDAFVTSGFRVFAYVPAGLKTYTPSSMIVNIQAIETLL